jgi:hypothetical protein
MLTFGNTNVGTNLSARTAGLTTVAKFTLSNNAIVSSMSWYGDKSGASSGGLKMLIYANNAGHAGALLGTTQAATVNSDTPQWWSANFASSLHLPAGDYWLGYVGEYDYLYAWDAGLTSYYDSTTGSYASPPDPYYESGNQDRNPSIYATYTLPSGCFLPFFQ